MYKFIKLLIGLSVMTWLISGCNKDFEKLTITPEIAVPIFTTSSSISGLFAENTDSAELVVSPEGTMMLVYRGQLVRREARDIFNAIPIFPGIMTDSILSAPFTLENEIRIIRAHFTSGNIFLQLRSDYQEDLDFILEFPDVTKNGESLKIETEIKYTGVLPVIITIPETKLAGYDINLNDLEVNVRYFAYLKSTGERVKLTNVGFIINQVEFSYLEGYFGYEKHQIDRDTIEIDIFKNIIQGNLEFADPRVTIITDNAFGFPLRSQITVLRLSNDQESADLESPQVNNGFDFAYPSLSEVGQVASTSFSFNNSNSNIKQIFNLYPTRLDYQIDAISNPDTIVDLIGFMTDSSYFAMGVRVELPLVGKASGFEADQEYDIDLSGLKDVKEAELKLVTENGIPIEVEVEAVLFDENNQPLLTLLEGFDKFLEAAPVDAQGNATGKVRKETFIQADEEMLNLMRQAVKVKIYSRFSTTNMGQTDVRIRPEDTVDVRMGLRAKIEHTLGDN
jgi:hypothetical protein